MSENNVSVIVVVNGVDYPVPHNVNAALQSLIVEALKLAKATASPDWQLKDEAGNVLDPQSKLRDLPAIPAKLYLSLKAGVNG